MATVFTLNKDGTVSMYMKPFFKTVSMSEFQERASIMDFDKFLTLFKDEKIKNTLILEMDKLQSNSNLSRVGPKFELDENGCFILTGLYIGKVFFNHFYDSVKQKEAAIAYGYRHYSKGIMDKLIAEGVFEIPESKNIVSGDQFVRFFINDTEISFSQYSQRSTLVRELSRLRDIKQPIENTQESLLKPSKKR